MEAYYSSDEEIAWGPVTLREIKGDLRRPVIRKPNRRHTVLANIQDIKMDSSSSSNAPESLSEEINKLNISGTSTTYYTPNQSIKTNNLDFLDKLSHVINNPSLEFSEYASILEDSENSNDRSKDMLIRNENAEVPDICITECSSINYNDTCSNFINDFANRCTQYDIERFHQTLVENSCISDNEKEDVIYEEDCESEVENANYSFRESINLTVEEDVIVISDDNENSFTNIDTEDFNKSIKKETADVDNVIDIENIESDMQNEEQDAEDNSSFDSGNRSHEVVNISEENDLEENYLSIPHRLSTIKESLSASPVIVPNIDLTQFDDSILKDESLKLDDTLEEMNRFLHQGLNYSMSNEEVDIDETPVKQGDLKPQQLFTNCTASGSSTNIKQQLFSAGKEKVSHIPRRNITSKSAEKLKKNKFTGNEVSQKTSFKVPVTPVQKHTNSGLPKSCPNRKNIVSPVALYIKSSPRFPLLQNVPHRDLHKIVVKSKKISNKENYPDFPKVCYKPSKNQISTDEKYIVIPSYLRKLNITEGCVTKHEGRINSKLGRTDVTMKLQEADITSASIDHSLLDNFRDISILTNKQAFIN